MKAAGSVDDAGVRFLVPIDIAAVICLPCPQNKHVKPTKFVDFLDYKLGHVSRRGSPISTRYRRAAISILLNPSYLFWYSFLMPLKRLLEFGLGSLTG